MNIFKQICSIKKNAIKRVFVMLFSLDSALKGICLRWSISDFKIR